MSMWDIQFAASVPWPLDGVAHTHYSSAAQVKASKTLPPFFSITHYHSGTSRVATARPYM